MTVGNILISDEVQESEGVGRKWDWVYKVQLFVRQFFVHNHLGETSTALACDVTLYVKIVGKCILNSLPVIRGLAKKSIVNRLLFY